MFTARLDTKAALTPKATDEIFLAHCPAGRVNHSALSLQVSVGCMLVHTKRRNLVISEFLEKLLLKQLTMSALEALSSVRGVTADSNQHPQEQEQRCAFTVINTEAARVLIRLWNSTG